MASSLSDSVATFQARCDAYGIPGQVRTDWANEGLDTYSKLLFRVASAPGQVDPAKQQELVNKVKQEDRTPQFLAALNRLLFEAGTFVVAELRQDLEGTGDAGKKLTPQERSSRTQAVRTRLGAWPVEGAFEPSHRLVDQATGMLRDQAIRYLPPSQCSSREAEIASTKRDDQLLRLENSGLRQVNKPQALRVDLGTDLRLYQALSRRGVAFEVAGVCTFDVHERYLRRLFDACQRNPPPGFQAATQDQLIRADRELWTQVAQEVQSQFGTAGSQAAVDAAITSLSGSAQVTFHLLPLPRPAGKRPWEHGPGDASGKKGQKGEGKTGKGDKGKDKGKGKGKSDGKQTNVPSALKGLKPKTQAGQAICFNYNLAHGCSQETKDSGGHPTCSRGAHVCMKCGGDHSASACQD